MNAKSLLDELKSSGRESYKKVLLNHGVREPCFGVAISELKKFQRRIKRDYQLALDLYATGNYDAMYLAGLIADDARMTRADLQHWLDTATHAPLRGSTVPWVAAGSPHGHALALEWIESSKADVAAAGWATLSSLVSIKPDTELDLSALKRLLARAQRTIHRQPDVVRYQMNGFVIAVGTFVTPLADVAAQTAERIGPVTANLGDNACQVPFAPDYLRKVREKGVAGKKRKSAKC